MNEILKKQTIQTPDPDPTVDLDQEYSAKRADNTRSALDRLLDDVQLDNASLAFDNKPEPAQKPVPSAIREGQDLTPAKRGVVKDVAVQIGGGVRDFVQNTGEGIEAVLRWGQQQGANLAQINPIFSPEQKKQLLDVNKEKPILGNQLTLPEVSGPQTIPGALTRGVTTFMLGFLPAANALKISKAVGGAAKLGKAVMAGGIADFFVFDGQAERLSNLVQEVPILANPVSEFLAADPNDTEIEGRLKNVLEGALLETGLASAFVAAMKPIRALRKMKNAPIDELEKAGLAATKLDEAPAEDILKTKIPLMQETKVTKELKEADELFDSTAPLDLTINIKDENKALNINLGNLNTTEDIDNIIKATSEIFGASLKKETRGVISNKELEILADDLGLTVKELLGRKTGEVFSPEKALAAKKIFVASAENVEKLSIRARSIDGSDKDMYMFRKGVVQHAAIMKQVVGLASEAGRLLNSYKILAGSQKELVMNIENALKNSGGRGTAKDLAQAVLEAGSLRNINKIINRAYKANGFDMVYEGWLNAILSGARTHAVNIASTFGNVFLQIPDRAFASIYGKAFGTADGVRMSEAYHMSIGMIQGVGDGLKMAKAAFDTEGLIDPLSKIELSNRQSITAQQVSQTFIGKTANVGLKALGAETLENGGVAARMVDFLGTAVRFPGFRMLATEDAFFKGMNYRMEVQALASRTAMNEGLSGNQMATRIRELIQKPSEATRVKAMTNAANNTFTNPNKVAAVFVKLKRNFPLLRYFFPFVNTPANIVKEAYQRTPFAFIGGQIKADILAGGVRRDLALGKVTTGSMLMAYAGKLAMDGRVTGSGPSDKRLNKIWRKNNEPYSFKFKKEDGSFRFISYNRLEPIGMLMGFSADFTNIVAGIGDDESDNMVAAASLSLTNNLSSKTWLRGVVNAIELVTADDTKKAERIFTDITSGFVPNAFNQFNGAFIDPVLRDARGFKLDQDGNAKNAQLLAKMVDAAFKKIPGMSQTLPARRGLWGQVVEPRGTFGDGVVEQAVNWLSPAYVRDVAGDKTNEMIVDNGVALTMPRRKMRIPGFKKAVELTGEEYNRFVELAGQPAKDILDRTINTAPFLKLSDGPDGDKAKHIRKIVETFRAKAKAQILIEFPELEDRALDLEE